jgi:hypothetical protein
MAGVFRGGTALIAGSKGGSHWAGFHIPGFPIFHGVIFWQDFVEWRTGQNGSKNPSRPARDKETVSAASKLPPRAAQILLEA